MRRSGDPTLVASGRSGQVKVLGVSSEGRWSLNPDIPTIGEAVPGFVSENWYGIAVPAKTPDDVVQYLFSQIAVAMSDDKTIKRFQDVGLEPAIMSMPEFEAYVREKLRDMEGRYSESKYPGSRLTGRRARRGPEE